MNFIIEFLPKRENVKELVVVVRNSQGYPLCVCDTLNEATTFIKEKVDDAIKSSETKK